MRLNYKVIGEGEPVVIAHGLFGSLDNWMTLAKSFGEFFEVYLVDMRNHGRSNHSNSMNYFLMAEDLFEFVNHQNLINPKIIGHSMGGKAAMQLVLNFPDLIQKLVVIDIGPKSYESRHDHIIAALKSLNLSELTSRKEADKLLSIEIADKGVRQFLLKGLYRKKDNSFKWKYHLPGIENNLNEFMTEVKGKPNHLPCLFLRGANSDYILDDDIIGIEELFPNSNIETITNAGHWIHADKPGELLNVILSFFLF